MNQIDNLEKVSSYNEWLQVLREELEDVISKIEELKRMEESNLTGKIILK